MGGGRHDGNVVGRSGHIVVGGNPQMTERSSVLTTRRSRFRGVRRGSGNGQVVGSFQEIGEGERVVVVVVVIGVGFIEGGGQTSLVMRRYVSDDL